MSDLWDKVKTELDKAGKAVDQALDEGKLRLDQFRVRQAADKAAEQLGYLVYRARKDGREPEQESYSRLIATLAEHDAELTRIDAELKKEKPASAGSTSSSGSDQAPSAGA
jgi:hypothetical protein